VTYTPSETQLARLRYRRRATVRSAVLATVSTLVVVVVLYVVVTGAPGWPRARETFFSWRYARQSFPLVLEGLWLNVRLMLGCGIVILALGLLLAILRTLKGPVFFPLRAIAAAYTDFFRGLPLVICLLVVGFGVPALRLSGVPGDPVLLGGTALVLTYSAYVAEVFRAGIESIHPSQRAASRSLGLTTAQTMRYVVLPQAVRRVVPPLLNDLVSLQKDTGLVSLLGVVDAVYAAQIVTGRTFNYTPFVVAGLVFVALTIPMTRLTDWATTRLARRQGHA
jgi:polar amino acid transport system permease protein